jgi:ABC-2 type transport system ATP-binding protein
MTVIDYLDYSASLHGVPQGQRELLVKDAIAKTGLSEKATQFIATLSRGYRQRTGVAQAILHKPKILILDEPTNGLDPTQIQHMRELIIDLAKSSTVIISTHILQEVQAICDRVIIVRDGKKVLDSRLDTLQKRSRLLVRTNAGQEQAVSMFNSFFDVTKVEIMTESQNSDPGFCYGLTLNEGCDRSHVASMVAAKIFEQGWLLYMLHFEGRDLESVFAEMSAR